MKKLLLSFMLFVCIIAIFITGCSPLENIDKPKQYYSQFKNPDLEYNWDFNSSLVDEKGEPVCGRTFGQNYFQLRKHNLFEELFPLKIPYPICYKHEEGHIYTNQLLNINNFDDFEANQSKFLNISNENKTQFRQYMISVSEGIADYYAIIYFNNSMSEKYFRHVEGNKEKERFKQYYQGFKFVNYSLNTQIYQNLTGLTLELGSREQYEDYLRFLEENK